MSELVRLVGMGLVRRPTADALFARREAPPDAPPSAFDEETFAILVAVCARLLPRFERPVPIEVARRIDARLASGKSDGWRYDELPSDGEAYARGLRSMDAEARARHGAPFAEIDGESADAIVEALQRGETRVAWDVSPARFVEDLLAEVVALAYAHPDAQEAIGYVGYADAKGWSRIGPNEREEWEA